MLSGSRCSKCRPRRGGAMPHQIVESIWPILSRLRRLSLGVQPEAIGATWSRDDDLTILATCPIARPSVPIHLGRCLIPPDSADEDDAG